MEKEAYLYATNELSRSKLRGIKTRMQGSFTPIQASRNSLIKEEGRPNALPVRGDVLSEKARGVGVKRE